MDMMHIMFDLCAHFDWIIVESGSLYNDDQSYCLWATSRKRLGGPPGVPTEGHFGAHPCRFLHCDEFCVGGDGSLSCDRFITTTAITTKDITTILYTYERLEIRYVTD
jgi:hypothetical protein